MGVGKDVACGRRVLRQFFFEIVCDSRSTTIILDDTLVWPSAASNFTLPSAQSLPVLVLLIALGMASHRVGFMTRATVISESLPVLGETNGGGQLR